MALLGVQPGNHHRLATGFSDNSLVLPCPKLAVSVLDGSGGCGEMDSEASCD